MKLLFLLLLLCFLIYQCGFAKADELPAFIPGTYTRFSQHEYGSEYDTLMIRLQNKAANEYAILRKWKYERILDGKLLEPEYKRIHTAGIYDPASRLIRDSDTGEQITFDSRAGCLFVGTVKYRKL